MSIDVEIPLNGLADWVRATDAHAPARLSLLDHAERILTGRQTAADHQRQTLAERLERWRYQLLATCGAGCQPAMRGADRQPAPPARLGGQDRRLADALDLAANRLVGGGTRPARWPRAAVDDHEFGDEEVATVRRCLEQDVPLDEVCRRAVTGRRMLLYAPLYLSSHCINHCVYCGFRYPHDIQRRHLDFDQAMRQADILMRRGFRHILLVAGDYPKLTTTEYFVAVIRALAAKGVEPPVEIAPQTTASYAAMAAAGACGVTLYQETYNESLYALYHPRGTKTSYDWRLEGLERAAEAGIRRLGLGFLLGLADPREDFEAMVRHAAYLRSRFPDATLAFSLPRIREAPEAFRPPYPVDDELFVRMYCALGIAFPASPLVLSTRERPELRNRLAKLCITQMSAGSCTSPGGYANGDSSRAAGRQFPVCDNRTADETAAWLRSEGFEVVWKAAAGM